MYGASIGERFFSSHVGIVSKSHCFVNDDVVEVNTSSTLTCSSSVGEDENLFIM